MEAMIIAAAAAFLWLAAAAGRWRCFQKMGCRGWEAVVPVYSTYLLFHELYGNGRRALSLLIPFYNILVFFRHSVFLARAFNRGAWFGAGLALLPFLFFPALGFGKAVYLDGSLEAAGALPERPLKTVR